MCSATLWLLLGCGSEASVAPQAPAATGTCEVDQDAGAEESSLVPARPSSSSGNTDEPAPSASTGPYPIVFLHGMAGFVTSGAAPFELVYFAGVLETLAGAGETEVFATAASPFANSWDRAQQIAPQIDAVLAATGASKVNLVAHSQGGLDARLLASPHGLGYGNRIASVTLIATPNQGTHVADLALEVLGRDRPGLVDPAVELLVRLLGRSFYDLTPSAKSDLRAQLLDLSERQMARVFNRTYIDDPCVFYQSYAGRTNLRQGDAACAGSLDPNPDQVDATSPLLQPTATLLEGNPFDPTVNDGLVTVASARYGAFVACLPADHMDEIGQLQVGDLGWHPFDHLAFYRGVVARLRALSF